MANNHGGARLGAGRKPRAETHRLPIARAEKRIADRLPELIDNLFILAMGGYERVEEQWVPAGTVESGGVYLFPNLPPEQLVLVVRKSSRADRDRAANIYLIDRILGKPVMAIDAEVSGPGGGPVPIAFAEAVRKIYGEPGDGDSGEERCIRAARLAGCPADQVLNLRRANISFTRPQLEASAAARECDRPEGPTKVGYGGARGGGKSHWGLAQVCCDDCQRYPGVKFLYLRKVGKAGREAVNDLRRDVLHSTSHQYKRQEGILAFPNGSAVVLGHFQNEKDIDSYLGLQYDGALIEEATQLTARKVKDISTCIRTSKPGWRPRTYFTTNPGNVGHVWFKKLFIEPLRSGRETETRFIQATVRDNAFVNTEYRRELETLSGWQRRAWLDGDWDIAAGQFYTTFTREEHVCKPFQVPREWRYWCALDYGFVHYTCVYLLALDGDGMLYVLDEHAERGWLPRRHAPAIHAMLHGHRLSVEDLVGFVAGSDVFQRGKDKDGLTIADQYQELGITLTAAHDDRVNGAAELLSRFGDPEHGIEPRIWISEQCSRLIECLPALQHDPSYPEKVKKWDTDDDGLGGDDPYDACRYGVMEAPLRAASWLDDLPHVDDDVSGGMFTRDV